MGWFKDYQTRRAAAKLASAQERSRQLEMRSMSESQLAEIAGGMFQIITAADSWLIPSVGWMDSSAERLLTASTWCCTAIMGNSRAIGQLPGIVQKRDGQRWIVAESNHPLWGFVDDPLGPDAELPYWSWAELIEWISVNRYLCGNAYMLPQIVGRRLYSVQPVLWYNTVQATENAIGVPQQFSIMGQMYDPSKVLNVRAPSPTSYWKGLAPVKAALNAIDLDYYSGERQKYGMRNKVAPGLIIGLKDAVGATAKQRSDLQADMIANYQSAEKTGNPWVVASGVDMIAPPTSESMQWIDTRRFARDEMLAVIGMPPAVAGVLDAATMSTYGLATVMWWNGFLFPVISSIYNAINAQVVRRLYPGYRLWYDLMGSDIGIQLAAERAKFAQQLVTLGYPTNDAAAAAGLEMPQHPALSVPNSQMVVSGRINPDGSPVKPTATAPSLPESGPRPEPPVPPVA